MRVRPSERESSSDGGGLGDGEAFAGASPAERTAVTKPERKRGPDAPGRSAGLLGDLAAWPADLRTLKRDLARGER